MNAETVGKGQDFSIDGVISFLSKNSCLLLKIRFMRAERLNQTGHLGIKNNNLTDVKSESIAPELGD